MSFPHHQAHQQSSVNWIDEYPESWSRTTLKRIVETPITDGPHTTPEFVDEGIPFVSAEAVWDGRIHLDSKRGNISEEDHLLFSRKYSPELDDVYIVKSGSTTGKVAFNDITEEFNIWSPLAAVRTEQSKGHSRFVYHALSSDYFQRLVQVSWSFGTQPNIGMAVLGNLGVILPPVEEQEKIANFLDVATAKIDALVTKKRELIELLEEKRRALISRCVTRGLPPDAAREAGLDPEPPMKLSGVEWLGEIPEHWEPHRLTNVLAGVRQGWSPQCENRKADKGEWGVLKVGCMNSGMYNESENKALPPELEPRPELEIRVNDVLMSRSNTRELVGLVGRVDETQGKILLCDKLYRLDFDEERIELDFAVYLLRAPIGRFQLERQATGASQSMKNISIESVQNVRVAIPPIDEQIEILKFIRKQTATIDKLVEMALDAVDHLLEYRSALITAAVTGKIDVREVEL